MTDAHSTRTDPSYAKLLSDLRDLDDGELVRQHDQLLHGSHRIDPAYYLQELARRDFARREESSARREARMSS